MRIKCEKPTIILNPNLENFIYKCKSVYTGVDSYQIPLTDSWWTVSEFRDKWSPKKNDITLDNFEQYMLVLDDGEMLPLYIIVPCGKCVLCKKRRSTDLAFRAMCESAYSKTTPLFITLTYKEAPDYGVCKLHLQKFFKRLRSALDYEGIKHEIRYFAVGEYGTNYGRPHYHALLWNFPYMQNWKVLCDFIRKQWNYGFIYVEPLKKGGTNYVLKYLRKEQTNVNGRNPTFYLASRKNGGLGSRWCLQHADFFRRNPDVLTCSVTDPYTKTTMTCAIPSYFKNKIFPTRSRLVDKSIRDIYKMAQYHLTAALQRFKAPEWIFTPVPEDMADAYTDFQAFRSKYNFLPCMTISEKKLGCDYFKRKDNTRYEKNKAWFDNYRYHYVRFRNYMSILKLFDANVREINWLLSNLENRNNYIASLEQVELNIPRLVEREKYDLERRRYKEVF